MGSGFSKRKKEARLFQEQLAKMQADMEESEHSGEAGNGLVAVKINGHGELKEISIKPECVDPEDVEGLELLIKAAFNSAHEKIQSQPSGIPPLPFG